MSIARTIASVALATAWAAVAVVACSEPSSPATSTASKANNVLRVGASPVPHAQILEQVRAPLAAQGITLQLVELTDYLQPNLALDAGDLDANFFQHQPYLDRFNADRRTDLVTVARVHVEPLGIYSATLKNLADIGDGAVVAIPNDPTNGARALTLLESGGLIRLKAERAFDATPLDVIDNPKHLVIKEIDAAQLARVLPDVAAAVINANYVLEVGLDPKTALLREQGSSRFANVVVVKRGHETDPRIAALTTALAAPTTAAFIEQQFRGAIVPAK